MGQYGGIVGGAVGAFIGFWVGGPTGAYYGWTIGAAVGGAYSASQQVIPGPKIGDVQKQTSQEGGFRPFVYGRSIPMMGNVIADSEPVIVKRKESQGKGGPKVETESAYRTYAVGMCEGETSLLQAWRNGILVYDVEDPSMSAENAKFLEYATWYSGSFTQMPAPELEAVYGVGNAPAFRGTSYLLLAGEDVTDQRAAWSQWQVRVFRGAISSGEPVSWMLSRASNSNDSVKDSPEGLDWTSSFHTVPLVEGGFFVPAGRGHFYYDRGSILVINNVPGFGLGVEETAFYDGDQWHQTDIPNLSVADAGQIVKTETHWFVSRYVGGTDVLISANGTNFSGIGVPGWTIAPASADGVLIARRNEINTTLISFSVRNFNGGLRNTPVNLAPGFSPEDMYMSGQAGSVILAVSRAGTGSNHIIRTYLSNDDADNWADNGDLITVTGTPIIRIHVGLDRTFISVNNRIAIGGGVSAGPLDPFVFPENIQGMDDDGEKLLVCGNGGMLYAWTPDDGWQVLSSGTTSNIFDVVSVGHIFPPGTITDDPWTLPQVISNICERASLSGEKINTSLLDQEKIVRGFTVGNTYQAAGILQTLSSVFFFDPANTNGKVSFVPRGRDVEETILEENMIDEGDDAEVEDPQSRRQDSIGIPRVLHLNYYDVAGGLNTDKQRSERPEGSRAEGEQSLQTPVVLSADEAASIVAITHGLMVEQQKGELSFALPDSWLRLTESDPIFVELNSKMVRAVLTKIETDDGEQKYKAMRDRQSLYTTEVQGIPAAPVTRPPSSVAGPTIIEFLDIPILRDAHDQLGFYMAVSGVLPAWPGALVELSLDGGATYIDNQSTRVGSTIGYLSSSLGDHPQEFPDEINTCEVEMATPNTLLENTDLSGMMNRINLAIVGDEIVNFANADEVSPGVWEISHWLRGRKGTETESHVSGERFVMLDTVMFVPAELVWLNRTLTFRATTFGRPYDESTIASVTFTGASQKERMPAYLIAYRDGTDIVSSWQGVGRLGGGVNVAMGAYFIGYRVTLTDGITTQIVDTTNMEYTGSLAAFVGPVTISIQQRNQITGLGPALEVTI